MGQEQSVEESESVPNSPFPAPDTSSAEPNAGSKERIFIEDEDEDIDIETLSAYRVMKVFQGSPSSRSGLRPFEDFIVAVNGSLVDSDKTSLANVLRDNEGKQVGLIVYNAIDAKKRDVALRPVKWNGPGLLGAAVRYEPIGGAIDHVLRVLDVLPNSPANQAGLMPNSDFIAGTPAEVFRNETEFYKMIHDALDRKAAASFMVYSTTTCRTRDVEIRPDLEWGGEGSLGCELATGLLHRITRSTTVPPSS